MAFRSAPNMVRVLVGFVGAIVLIGLTVPGSDAQATTVVINELQPRNSTTIVDGAGDTEDWIELRNTTSADIDLTGWRIEDSGAQWPFPAGTTIAANGYLLVWASDKGDPLDPDFPGPAGELHANFQLNGTTDTVTLLNAGAAIVDTVSYDLPFAQDESYDGDASDFIELLNTGFDPIDLGLWQISDESGRSIIPWGTVLGRGDTLILWASGKGDVLDGDYPGPAGEIHLTFRLAGDGEQLTFAEPSECIVEQFVYPELQSNQAYGYDAQGQRAVIDPGASEAPCAAAGSVQIVALSPRNDTGRTDEDGDFGDWIELVNLGDATIDLSGYRIGDEEDIWTIPDGVEIEAGGFLLLWADGGDRGEAGGELHTNFKLAGEGEPITLIDADGEVVASLSSYPELDDDETFGIDEAGDYVVFEAGNATPGDGPTRDGCDFELTAGPPTMAPAALTQHPKPRPTRTWLAPAPTPECSPCSPSRCCSAASCSSLWPTSPADAPTPDPFGLDLSGWPGDSERARLRPDRLVSRSWLNRRSTS